jgi:hypothetical protein
MKRVEILRKSRSHIEEEALADPLQTVRLKHLPAFKWSLTSLKTFSVTIASR